MIAVFEPIPETVVIIHMKSHPRQVKTDTLPEGTVKLCERKEKKVEQTHGVDHEKKRRQEITEKRVVDPYAVLVATPP